MNYSSNPKINKVCILIDKALVELHSRKPKYANPYENQCYIASAVLKKTFMKLLVLYRTKDNRDNYHYWCETKEGEVIDITGQQYVLMNVPIPSSGEAARNKQKARIMTYTSYKKRIDNLMEIMDEIKD